MKDCVLSIQRQPDQPFEIIVVDNGSTDRTAKIAEQLGCRVIFEERQGLSYARNQGALSAKGDIVCFIDADCVLGGRWLQAARRCFSQPQVGAVSGISVYRHPNLLKLLWYNQYTLFISGATFLSSILLKGMAFAGNNLAMRRPLFLQLGGFEDVIGEGMWLSRRFSMQAGYTGKFCPGMLLWNSPRGFEALGFLKTVSYWVKASISRTSQKGYTYKSRL